MDHQPPSDSALKLLQTIQLTRSQSDTPHSIIHTIEDSEEHVDILNCNSPVDFPHPSNLQRATSDRVSSTGSHLNASHPPSSGNLSHWTDQTNLRRHQSMKSDGKWGARIVTSPNCHVRSRKETIQQPQTNDLTARSKLDTFYELGSSVDGAQSTDLLRSSSHRSSSSAFSGSMSAHPSSTGNLTSFPSTQATGIVNSMSSPVGVPGLSINPWSPSIEEAKKLREPILRQSSLDTLASQSSTHSRPINKSSNSDLSRFRSSSNDDSKLHDTNLFQSKFSRLNLSGKNSSEEINPRSTNMALAHHRSGVKSPLSTSTSLADLNEGATTEIEASKPHDQEVAPPKKVVLPPLVTDFSSREASPNEAIPSSKNPNDSVRRPSNRGSIAFQGPASAAAFVPPIGHSISRNLNDPFSYQEKMALMVNHNTAAPGIGASTWLTQKERLIGESQSRQQPASEWSSPMNHSSPSSQPPSTASVPALPHQIQQQIILNQQLQQLQQLQVQQHQLQQQQAQLLSSTMGIPPSATTPVTGFNTPSIGNLLQSHPFSYGNISPATSNVLFGPLGNPNPTVTGPAPPNPSRLQTTITGLPGLAGLSGTAPMTTASHMPSSVGMVGSMSGSNMYMAKTNPLMNNLSLTGLNSFSVQDLVRRKGYNPIHFDLTPKSARFFVIKSYTEEDVHKSLKYEIWASTDLGNKRLDRAFNESHGSGPIYLLFSVNASGHFCGMAEMLTAVDYNTTSKVWAQDKWKGIFKVKWIFVKDIPNNALRHIKLTNTPENKPITSSRDTQEVPHDKGIQVLQIMSSYQSRTTLLQDYAWYEHNESLKAQQQGSDGRVQVLASNVPQHKNPHHQAEVDPPNPNGSIQHRHSKLSNHQSLNQNIRRFTNGPSHPGQVAQVTVQVASGV